MTDLPVDTAQTFSGSAPRFFANGFAIGVSNSDVLLDFRVGGESVSVTHMSYTLAKTLSIKLAMVIAEFEKRVGRPMLTTDDVDGALAAIKSGEATK